MFMTLGMPYCQYETDAIFATSGAWPDDEDFGGAEHHDFQVAALCYEDIHPVQNHPWVIIPWGWREWA